MKGMHGNRSKSFARTLRNEKGGKPRPKKGELGVGYMGMSKEGEVKEKTPHGGKREKLGKAKGNQGTYKSSYNESTKKGL